MAQRRALVQLANARPYTAVSGAVSRRIKPRCATRSKNGNYRNGNWTAEAIEERRWLRSLVQTFANIGTTE